MNSLNNKNKLTFSQPKTIQNHSFNIHPQKFHNRPLNSQSVRKNNTQNSNSKIKIKFNDRYYQAHSQNNYQIVNNSIKKSINPEFNNTLSVSTGFNYPNQQFQHGNIVKNSSNPDINNSNLSK